MTEIVKIPVAPKEERAINRDLCTLADRRTPNGIRPTHPGVHVQDRFNGLVVRVLAYQFEGPGIPGLGWTVSLAKTIVRRLGRLSTNPISWK